VVELVEDTARARAPRPPPARAARGARPPRPARPSAALAAPPDADAAPAPGADGPAPTPAGVALTLFIAAAGAGLLSYPFAVHQQGVALALASTLACAGATVFTDRVLVATAALLRRGGALAGARDFDALAGAALGPRARAAAAASILAGTGGALVGFLIIIGDLLEPPLRAAAGCGGGGGGGALCALARREFLIPAVALLVALPLSSLRALASLKHATALAAASVLAIAGVLVAAGTRAAAGGGLAAVAATARAPRDDAPGDVVLARAALAPFFLGLPIQIFTLGNHCQLVPAYLEAAPGSAAARRFGASIVAAVGACVALYSATGVAGYVAFRAATAGDVLLNLPAADAAAGAAKVLLALHVALAYPVLIFPARALLEGAAARAAAALAARGAPRRAALAGAFAASPLPAAAALTAAAAALAVALPQVSVVFGLVGATSATLQIHLLPGLYLLCWADAVEGRAPRLAARGGADAGAWRGARALAAGRGGGGGGGGEAGAAPLLGEAGGEAGAAEAAAAAAAAEAEPALAFLSASPRVLRAQGAALVACFAVVSVLGTGAFVAQTWL